MGKNVIYLNVFKRNDTRTIYNVLYQDGRGGIVYMKRFAVTGVTRDREYDLTQGKPGSKVMWFTANPNGEAEVLRITLKPKPRLKVLQFDIDLAELGIKGKLTRGNLVTKNEVHRISLKEHGVSTLGDREVWFDPDVNRINYDEHGRLLGEFNEDDAILVVLETGEFYITNFDANNHYEDNIRIIEKWEPEKAWTAVVVDADNGGFYYLKRFCMEATQRKQSFLGDNPKNRFVLLTDTPFPRLEVTFGGNDAHREPMVVDAEEFIAVKGFKAKGKRLTTFDVEKVTELEPLRFPEPPADDNDNEEDDEPVDLDRDAGKSQQQVIDEMTGQLNLFTDGNGDNVLE